MMSTSIRLILAVDPYGGCGVLTKADSADGRRIAEELHDYLREDISTLFRKASLFQEHWVRLDSVN